MVRNEKHSKTIQTELQYSSEMNVFHRAGGVYGGWSFGWHQDSPRVTIWFHNKGWHILPSYVNLLNNVALRLNSSKSPVKGDVGYFSKLLF